MRTASGKFLEITLAAGSGAQSVAEHGAGSSHGGAAPSGGGASKSPRHTPDSGYVRAQLARQYVLTCTGLTLVFLCNPLRLLLLRSPSMQITLARCL